MPTIKILNNPKVGDIIFGEDNFIIGKLKSNDSNIIEVGFTKEQCLKKEIKIEYFFSKGKTFENEREIIIDKSIIDKTRSTSTWFVEKIEYKPSLKLLHSVLQESYLITARKLQDELTEEVIEFYTFGSFQNTIHKEVEVIGTIN